MSSPSLPGDRDAPAPVDPVAAEIEAEIADHLATAAERLESHGVSSPDARQKSQDKFGNAIVIGRRCYWIKQGDDLMFRGALIALLSALVIGLAVTVFISWQSQSRMAEQMSALAEQLKELAERQKEARSAPPISTEPKPLAIAGNAYIGSPDKPAGHVRIGIIDVKDGSRVRTTGTDTNGNFTSGPLGGGDYALVAETAEKSSNGEALAYVQSAPIGVYPGLSVPSQKFDIVYHRGQLAIETSRPLPKLTAENRYTIDTRILLKVYSSQERTELWIEKDRQPLCWPVYTSYDRPRDVNHSRTNGSEFYDLLSQDDIRGLGQTRLRERLQPLPAGKVEVAVAILADVFPVGYERSPIPNRGALGRNVSDAERSALSEWEWVQKNFRMSEPISARVNDQNQPQDNYYWMTKGLGYIWFGHLQGPAEEKKTPRPHLVSANWLSFNSESRFPVKDRQVTRLRIEVPDDLESRIQQLIDSTMDPSEFSNAVLGEDSFIRTFQRQSGNDKSPPPRRVSPQSSPFFREAKITLVGTEPVKTEESPPAAGDSVVRKKKS